MRYLFPCDVEHAEAGTVGAIKEIKLLKYFFMCLLSFSRSFVVFLAGEGFFFALDLWKMDRDENGKVMNPISDNFRA